MKAQLGSFLLVASAGVLAHPGHGEPGWFHRHEDLLIDIAMFALAGMAVAFVVFLVRKLARR